KGTLGQCGRKTGQSQFWNGLMQVKDLFSQFCTKKIGNGKRTRFWKDQWLGPSSLQHRYPRLYCISMNQDINVFDANRSNVQILSFRRNFTTDTYMMWQDLQNHCSTIRLTSGEDKCHWFLEKNGVFSVRSFYNALVTRRIRFPFRQFWKLKMH
ncbi:hypothetical protein BRADI_4g25858v3, partial [Brachypodium distachyon]